MKEKYLVMDVALCHDCNNCFMACTDEHADNDWAGYQKAMPWHGHRWMNIERRERGENDRVDVAFLAKPCQQCENAACAQAGDFIKRREDGIVVFDTEKGSGKDISASCPFGAVYWNEEAAVSQKCDFCAHLLDDPTWEHGVPRCVHSCPTGSLKFYTEDPAEFAKRIAAEGLEAYKPELGANPHVWYKNLYRFTKNFVAGQLLKDGDVASGALVKIAGDGVAAEQETDMFGEYRFDDLADGDYVLAAAGKEIAKVTVAGGSKDAGDIAI
ncbi:MAG: oxidoreductase [Clostridiales Family XIII bacterium]|jgi:Fe-S-cluster-containing dehydrogenase component|nr:oxidoreductase [Clostridiales Family XIII bacterium]